MIRWPSSTVIAASQIETVGLPGETEVAARTEYSPNQALVACHPWASGLGTTLLAASTFLMQQREAFGRPGCDPRSYLLMHLNRLGPIHESLVCAVAMRALSNEVAAA